MAGCGTVAGCGNVARCGNVAGLGIGLWRGVSLPSMARWVKGRSPWQTGTALKARLVAADACVCALITPRDPL